MYSLLAYRRGERNRVRKVELGNDCSRCAGAQTLQIRRACGPRSAIRGCSLPIACLSPVSRLSPLHRWVTRGGERVKDRWRSFILRGFRSPTPKWAIHHPQTPSVGKRGQRHVQKGCLLPCLPQLDAVSKPTRRLGQLWPHCQAAGFGPSSRLLACLGRFCLGYRGSGVPW